MRRGRRHSIILSAALVILLSTGFSQPARRLTWGKFQAGDVKIAYVMRGAGTPVVLIHGWLSSAGINWQLPGTMALLARDYQVIALDVRGHGLSDKPTREEAYGEELVQDIVRLLDHLEIEKAHIVGYSMGGVIAANFITKHPYRVLSGTLCGMGWLKAGGVAQHAFRQIGRNDEYANAHAACGRSLAKLALTQAELKSIRVPVAVLVGEQDELIKELYIEPMRRVRKDWPVIEIAEANHISCIFKPQFQREIAAWLRKNSK